MKVHKTHLKVRYAETDRMGVVYHANYLIYFEVARTEYLHACGVSYREIEEKDKLYLMVRECRLIYKSPATYDDELVVETSITEIKNASLVFSYKVHRESVLIAEGATVHVFTTHDGRPTKIPPRLKSLFQTE